MHWITWCVDQTNLYDLSKLYTNLFYIKLMYYQLKLAHSILRGDNYTVRVTLCTADQQIGGIREVGSLGPLNSLRESYFSWRSRGNF